MHDVKTALDAIDMIGHSKKRRSQRGDQRHSFVKAKIQQHVRLPKLRQMGEG
ncbi:hypothetical protein [Lysinibacillus sp. FW12]|uniref:hypothetical protein n=1 Tax=Lysinibacillus sp. FW12 TaxID=3096079 RepID=UPI003D715B08